ncbi:outer membrane protein assembly factor BamE [Litchfieldella qijiaojingensis]|uniref:Outer membrane protein assembly factor BamE n=1 Tax=Litchfieldella qijiaojingensis TaxID=980347 RepID=A0ABQ2YJM2_9GAMM|nr:outer membrane protein assembly factor BamE [Halomonas qijiaojingensis]GGX85183.1 outer membrane protein assembly factor BamE [Halomonas qijiaojingensis]
MQKLIKMVTLSLVLSLAGGCSYLGVYKRDLPQGNLVTQEMVAQLEPGMTREQVKFVMGSPLLEAPFSANQWDYLYRLDEAYGDVEQRRVTLTFANDRLVNITTEGDLASDIELPSVEGVGPAPAGAGPEDSALSPEAERPGTPTSVP